MSCCKTILNLHFFFFLLATEYLFDWFIMAYINGIRAFGDRSSRCSQVKKSLSTERWQHSVALAEKAHWMLREGAVAATPEQKRFEDAESMAERGVELLKQRFVIQCCCLGFAIVRSLLAKYF